MTTATAQDRLRQIAILVSSVDADASRQLLLHLPTEKARQVRAMAAQLGSIAPAERRQILAEFQRSATSAPPKSTASTSREIPPRETIEPPPSSNRQSDSGAASWTRLSSSALARFVRSERPAVSAVVISRLAPGTAVDVLQHLTTEAAHDILRRLSDLQEIDPEAMEAIDEHLSQRLGEYQHHMESELENSRRIHALLEAAPAELRQQWSQILSSSAQTGQSDQPTEPLPPPEESRQEPAAELDIFDLGGTTLFATDAESNELKREEPAEILSLSQAAARRTSSLVDSAAIQQEFQHILHLPQHLLAQLLSETDSESVLLALAGATPDFMKRFYNMLDRNGARALQSRLQRIGAIQLRDIDEAQRRIVQRAAALAGSQAPLSGMGGMRRAA